MATNVTFDVASLDAAHRRAIEELIGSQLHADQQVTIGVGGAGPPRAGAARGDPPAIEDWQSLYDGLSEAEIEQIDKIINTRANLTRDLP
jgi:hypothetical protein